MSKKEPILVRAKPASFYVGIYEGRIHRERFWIRGRISELWRVVNYDNFVGVNDRGVEALSAIEVINRLSTETRSSAVLQWSAEDLIEWSPSNVAVTAASKSIDWDLVP